MASVCQSKRSVRLCAPIGSVFAVFALAASGFALDHTAAQNSKCLNIGVVPETYSQSVAARTKAILADAGICMNIQTLPNSRAVRLLETGEIDGDAMRVMTYLRQVEDYAFRIETPFGQSKGYKVHREHSCHDHDDQDQTDHDRCPTGIVKGHVWFQDFVQKEENFLPANTSADLRKLVEAGRVHHAYFLRSHYSDEWLERVDGEAEFLGDVTFHMFLHKKHIGLKDRIETALKNFDAQ